MSKNRSRNQSQTLTVTSIYTSNFPLHLHLQNQQDAVQRSYRRLFCWNPCSNHRPGFYIWLVGIHLVCHLDAILLGSGSVGASGNRGRELIIVTVAAVETVAIVTVPNR